MAQPASKTFVRAANGTSNMTVALDRGHLARMTFGDRTLERDLLQLFDRQAAILIERIRVGDATTIAALAHTLKGSASSIGIEAVARAAEAVELAAGRSPDVSGVVVDRLIKAVDEARALIVELLREQ
jgi:HPt (histidine-containing phosphotransfer) domain-containing protein